MSSKQRDTQKPSPKTHTRTSTFTLLKHKNDDSRYRVPALEKGLDVLEALATDSVPKSLSEMSRLLHRTSSELFRILDCLERRNYVVRDELYGSYSLSLKLFELAHIHSPVEHLLRSANSPMRTLALTVRESCHLSVVSDGKLLVLAQAESPDKIRLSIEVGGRFSLLHTTSGKLLLAHLPGHLQTEVLQNDPEWKALTKNEREEVLIGLRRATLKGSYVENSETRPNMKDLAVLIGNPRIGVTAALCIPCLLSGRDEGSLTYLMNALEKCASEIDGALGLSSSRANP